MRIAGGALLGVTALVLAACGADDDGPRPRADVAGSAYEKPADAPAFCTRLALLAQLDRLPTSIGTLAAGPDVQARIQVSQTTRELRAVLADIWEDGGHDELSIALEELVHALGSAVETPLADPALAAISAGLARVGEQTQPTCGFPT